MSKKEEKQPTQTNEKKSAESSDAHVKHDKMRVVKWVIVVGLFLFSGLISFYFISPYRLINEITVVGSVDVYDQVILESSQLSSGDSIWENYLNRDRIEEKIIQENPQVSQANLSLSGMQAIVITIEEYQTVAYLSNDNSYKKILENGKILENSVPRLNATEPILTNFEQGRPLLRLIDEYEKVDEDIQAIISEIDYIDHERNAMLVTVYMDDGNEVLVTIPNFSERLNYYREMKATVDDTKGLFDLEAGAYFIPFSSEEEPEEIEEFE